MFPDSEHLPPEFSEMCVRFPVAFDVAGKLLRPPRRVPLRRGLVIGAPMPEAAVNEHGDFMTRKQDVGSPARQARQDSVDAIAKAPRVEEPPQRPLRICVPRPLT